MRPSDLIKPTKRQFHAFLDPATPHRTTIHAFASAVVNLCAGPHSLHVAQSQIVLSARTVACVLPLPETGIHEAFDKIIQEPGTDALYSLSPYRFAEELASFPWPLFFLWLYAALLTSPTEGIGEPLTDACIAAIEALPPDIRARVYTEPFEVPSAKFDGIVSWDGVLRCFRGFTQRDILRTDGESEGGAAGVRSSG